MTECECEKPILQPQTRLCGKCNKYIDRIRHIILTNHPSEIETPLKKLIRWEYETTYMFDSDYRVAMALLEKIRNEGMDMLIEEDKLIETYKKLNTNENISI